MAVEKNTVDPEVRTAISEWASQGPLLAQCGFRSQDIVDQPDRWVDLGRYLGRNLGFDGWEQLDDFQRTRVYHYYLPVFFYVEHQLKQHVEQRKAAGLPERPLVFGVSAPQGSGKSTLVEQLVGLLKHTGRSAVDVSIDDFYLTYEDQQRLAKEHPDNPLLQVRGNAGTHDLALGRDTLEALTTATGDASEVPIPRYDKSQHCGRGDRAPQETWLRVRGKLDVVLFEGWMLGFPAKEEQSDADALDADLAAVNSALRRYVDAWDSFVDTWLVIKVADPSFVFKWRMEAETKMRAKGKPGMSDEEVVDFVNRYMPAYKAYLPDLYARGPSTAKPGHVITVELDENRKPLAKQVPTEV